MSFDCGPVRVVSVTVTGQPDTYRVFRGWSNGDVDATGYRFDVGGVFGCGVLDQCGPVPIIPPPCTADVNDDLAVNVLDLIDVLVVFGESCPTGG